MTSPQKEGSTFCGLTKNPCLRDAVGQGTWIRSKLTNKKNLKKRALRFVVSPRIPVCATQSGRELGSSRSLANKKALKKRALRFVVSPRIELGSRV